MKIEHFTVVCLVAWPLNDIEAEVDFVLIETSLLFYVNFLRSWTFSCLHIVFNEHEKGSNLQGIVT